MNHIGNVITGRRNTIDCTSGDLISSWNTIIWAEDCTLTNCYNVHLFGREQEYAKGIHLKDLKDVIILGFNDGGYEILEKLGK
jgi:hypothetical protein